MIQQHESNEEESLGEECEEGKEEGNEEKVQQQHVAWQVADGRVDPPAHRFSLHSQQHNC
jgi:hypothetical protein